MAIESLADLEKIDHDFLEIVTIFIIANYQSDITVRGKLTCSFETIPKNIDLIIIGNKDNFDLYMRRLLSLIGAIPVIPYNLSWIVNDDLRFLDSKYLAWNTTDATNYIARCGLRGHYLEFGTFWGKSFFNNYFMFNRFLDGYFFGFDCFKGLPDVSPLECKYTSGDFSKGQYISNMETFNLNSKLLNLNENKFRVIDGFFTDTVSVDKFYEYGIRKRSVSICYIDCDIFDSTKTVLNCIGEYLEDGALIYFDDWRLCRASSKVGERGAALQWLNENQSYELIEFSRSSWQNQWFIFQRK